MKIYYLLFLSIFFQASIHADDVQLRSHIDQGMNQFEFKFGDGTKGLLKVDAEPPPKSDFYAGSARWGSFAGYTRGLLIREIHLQIAGEDEGIPLSAYSDLCNPNEVTFRVQNKEVIFRMRGGDEGTSYIADFHFRKSYGLYRRSVTYGEMPGEYVEETTYGNGKPSKN